MLDVLKDILRAIWEFLAGLPREVYGERLDSGLGIAAATYVTIVAIAFAIGAVRSVWELAKALDLRFDKNRIEEYNLRRPNDTAPREIDWLKARKQQIRSLLFALPFGAITMATLFMWVRYAFTFDSYVYVAVGVWLPLLLVVRPWWLWTYLATQRKLVKSGVVPAQQAPFYDKSLMWAMRHYFAWGLQNKTLRRRAFIGIFRFLNPLVSVFGLQWLRLRLIKPMIQIAFYAAIWALSGPIAVFHLEREFDARHQALKPEWARGRASEPQYGTGAIGDTPGDAGAASH